MPKRSTNLDTTLPAKRRKQQSEQENGGHVTAAGIITRIELKNFMNHAYLCFDFQPRVNFVTGRNGTGKSALLTGLMVGLGGKASATSRGNQLSGFVQYGKHMADTKVTLNNTGPDAYRPEDFGDSIVVERKLLARSGGGDYKIKTAAGKLVSTKKTDLMRILEHFNIQVENPVAILNQETSKNFLLSKNPSDVYKFFIKATKLEQMQHGYTAANKEFQASMNTLRSKESILPALELELKHAKERAAALESLDKLRTKLGDKQCELAWAIVHQKEVQYESMKEKFAKLEKNRPKYEIRVTKSKDKLEEADKKKKEIEERIRSMAGDTETLGPRRTELQAEYMQKKQITRTHADSLKQVNLEIARQEKDKKDIQDRIDVLQASSQVDRSTQKKERDKKLEKLNKKLQDVQVNCANAKAELTNTQHSLSALREEKNEHASSVGDCERAKKVHQQKITQLERSRSNKSMRFGRSMPTLLDEIERLHRAGKFRKKPIGPLGAHITIKDMKYALGAERALGGIMTAFYVDNQADAQIVNQLKRRICVNERQPDVFIGKFCEHRYQGVERDRAATEHPTLMDLLIIDNSCVFNCLIDQISIHNIVMVLDGKRARHLMFKNKPQNCFVCFDEKGDEIRPKPDRVFANQNKRPNYLSSSVEEDIKAETQQLRDVCKTLNEATTRFERVSLQIQSNHERHIELKSSVNTLERQLRKIQSDIDDLNAQVLEEETTGDVEALISDVENLDVEIKQLKVNLKLAKEKYNNSIAEEKQVEKQLKEIKDKIRSVNSSVDPLRAELSAADDNIAQAKGDLNHYKNELKKFDDKMKQEETTLNNFLSDHVERDAGVASQMSQRVKSRKSPDSLQAEIKKIKEQIGKEEQLKGDADEIRAHLNTVSAKYGSASNQLKQCLIYRKEMQTALKLRRKNLQTITVSHADQIKMYFVRYLHQRNYDGKLHFDFDDQKLEIKVYPPSGGRGGEGDNKDLRGLSGGEKSFSTLCFMMSLWDSVASPIRCMDEFDVFMDMVNRRVSIKMLIEFAKTNPSNQFILLTPQDTSQIEPNNFVHIYRMPDPKRGGVDGDQTRSPEH